MKNLLVTVSGLLIALLLTGCGEEREMPVGAASYLPGEIQTPEVEISGAIEVFRGDSLYQHINGGAEIYHTYGFKEVANAYYLVGDKEISVDLYEFETPAGAFGLYSTLRPLEPVIIDVGVEGFSTSHTRDFVKGKHVARLSAFEADPETTTALDSLAVAIAENIPGSTTLPPIFDHFPDSGRIAHSEKIYSMAYLGLGDLNDVHTVDYLIGDDSLTLFLTMDPDGRKMEAWRDGSQGTPVDLKDTDRLGFDSPPHAVEHNYYGTIVAGSKSDWLAGAVGYDPSLSEVLTRLLASLEP